MINLTREEAQQVLDALVFATPSGCGPAEAYKDAIVLLQNLLAHETPYEVGQRLHRQGLGISDIPTAVYSDSDITEAYRGFEAARLSAPEPSIVEDAIVYGTGITMGGNRIDPASIYKEPEPEPVRLRRGDILRCIETNELCTVWATSTTGKTLVKWKANDFGEYTAEQIGDLFWVEPKPEPEPVAWMNEGDIGKTDWKVWAHGKPTATIPLYTTPPQREWQGLTDEEILEEYRQSYGDDGNLTDVYFARAIEAKLKEKNGG
jgi:hypothetical protein